MKRIIVCCDGTGQNGTVLIDPKGYTNILRITRIINTLDKSANPPIPQIVFYQQGIGSENNFYTEFLKEWLHAGNHDDMSKVTDTLRKYWQGTVSTVDDATGATLADKVQEAYAFIANNYEPGDKIYLFGFSRGAYTARMVAAFIGEIGIFTREGMDSFGDTFVQHQIIGHSSDADAARKMKELKQFPPGILFEDTKDKNGFSIEVVGVFDTVGSVGLPIEIVGNIMQKNIFGFSDALLGGHIRYAYHALALDEPRRDFYPVLWEQTPEGRARGQQLVQCWFRGSHSDVGGGWDNHELSDISLVWMLANIQDKISINTAYLEKIPEPACKWGKLPPHNALTGPYRIAAVVKDRLGLLEPRPPPIQVFHEDKHTNEVLHASIQEQDIPEYLKKVLDSERGPALYAELLPLETQMRAFINSLQLSSLVEEDGDLVDTVSRTTQKLLMRGESDSSSILKSITGMFSPR